MTKRKSEAKTSGSPAKSTSKKEAALALLRRDGGATLDEIVEATGWLRHSARAVFTGMRKAGFTIAKNKVDGTNRYTVVAEPKA